MWLMIPDNTIEAVITSRPTKLNKMMNASLILNGAFNTHFGMKAGKNCFTHCSIVLVFDRRRRPMRGGENRRYRNLRANKMARRCDTESAVKQARQLISAQSMCNAMLHLWTTTIIVIHRLCNSGEWLALSLRSQWQPYVGCTELLTSNCEKCNWHIM